ncbi:hypothetical protein [Deinococcus fonticola]|uniref:hypothetical protein n=1 Tax=Deinococcus fonticola TaxID=2528713 RepID=UPI0010751FBF|nr:hypothetical protein [Deinococcus fonticola]
MNSGTPHYALDQMTEDAWRMFRILGEFSIGFDRMAHQQVSLVTVYGSARTPLTDRYYGLSEELVVRAGFGVVTGGGPGIMQAAISFVGEAHWRGLVEWFSTSLVQNGAIAPDGLNLFKLIDDVTAIPADVLNYRDPAQVDGFKRPTALER